MIFSLFYFERKSLKKFWTSIAIIFLTIITLIIIIIDQKSFNEDSFSLIFFVKYQLYSFEFDKNTHYSYLFLLLYNQLTFKYAKFVFINPYLNIWGKERKLNLLMFIKKMIQSIKEVLIIIYICLFLKLLKKNI